MSDTTSLSREIGNTHTSWNNRVAGKTIEGLGGTDNALMMVINEINLNIYKLMYDQAVQFENFLSVYEANNTIIDNNFTTVNDALTTLTKNLNESLQAMNKQMTNQNKVLDKQVIKLSKSISKITGER